VYANDFIVSNIPEFKRPGRLPIFFIWHFIPLFLLLSYHSKFHPGEFSHPHPYLMFEVINSSRDLHVMIGRDHHILLSA
jgi:hypothetical protein